MSGCTAVITETEALELMRFVHRLRSMHGTFSELASAVELQVNEACWLADECGGDLVVVWVGGDEGVPR